MKDIIILTSCIVIAIVIAGLLLDGIRARWERAKQEIPEYTEVKILKPHIQKLLDDYVSHYEWQRDNEDEEGVYEREIDIVDAISEVTKLRNGYWAVNINEVQDLCNIPYPDAEHIQYYYHWTGKTYTRLIEKNSTWLHLWIACDSIIGEVLFDNDGKVDHRFIEWFDVSDDGTILTMHTGS